MTQAAGAPRAILIKPSTIRLERLLPGPVERVWAYLVDARKRATWLAGGEFDLRVGGRIELIFNNDQLSEDKSGGGERRFDGTITRLEPLKALAFTWNWDGKPSDVLFELQPRGKDVLLVIHHHLPDERGIKLAVGGGWDVHTGILDDVLSGRKPRGFWTEHARLSKALEATIS